MIKNRKLTAITWAGMLMIVLLCFTISVNAEESALPQGPDCERIHNDYLRECDTKVPGNNWEKHAQCLRDKLKTVPEACTEETGKHTQKIIDFYANAPECMAVVSKGCRVDIRKGMPAAEHTEEVIECALLKWDSMNEKCKDYWRVQFSAIKGYETGFAVANPEMTDEEIEAAAAEVKQKKARLKARGKYKVAGTGKTVMAEAREGDLIWYVSKPKKRTVVDHYEFCPPIKGQGLEVEQNENTGTCIYNVTAPWEKELIEELKKENLLEKIDYWGVIRKQELAERYPRIKQIIERWSVNCPERFRVDVQEEIKDYQVTCERTDYDTCKAGYIKSWHVKGGFKGHNINGIFGCVKLSECEAAKGEYYYWAPGAQPDRDAAAYCQNCYAGGCADYEMSEQMQAGWLCKVNYKDPSSTPPCSAYDAKD